jgi:dienelactone hydrolase
MTKRPRPSPGALFKPPGAGPFPAVVYMPGCKDPGVVSPSAPIIVLIGDGGGPSPAPCQAIAKNNPNLDVVVYAGASDAFAMPGLDMDFLGGHIRYDEKATKDAEQRIDAFLAAHMK